MKPRCARVPFPHRLALPRQPEWRSQSCTQKLFQTAAYQYSAAPAGCVRVDQRGRHIVPVERSASENERFPHYDASCSKVQPLSGVPSRRVYRLPVATHSASGSGPGHSVWQHNRSRLPGRIIWGVPDPTPQTGCRALARTKPANPGTGPVPPIGSAFRIPAVQGRGRAVAHPADFALQHHAPYLIVGWQSRGRVNHERFS